MVKRTLQELTLKDNFMFGAVMADEDICREFLELALEIPVERVVVSKERSIVYRPEYKGIRLDVYARDLEHTHYNVEMQVVPKPALSRRARYYHGQLDMESLLKGKDYTELPDSYVIFICDFDPFDRRLYRYSFPDLCREDTGLSMDNGSVTIFLSTQGQNKDEVPNALVNFLNFVKADLAGSMDDYEDDFVKRLQASIRKIKSSREMEGCFMIFEEMLRDERAEGKAEGKAESILKLLEDIGNVSKNLQDKILQEKNLEVLDRWVRLAAKADSIEQFAGQI